MGTGRVLIVANPHAGTVTPALVWEVVRLCRREGRQVSVRWTTGPGEATRIARKAAESVPTLAERALALPTLVPAPQQERSLVVAAVGGDGTVREVAAGLASAWRGASQAPLLVVPAGTANSCYHRLFGTAPWQSTLSSVLREPEIRLLDLARVAGRLAFAARAFQESQPCPGRVTVDGRVIHSGLTRLVDVTGGRDGLLGVSVLDGEHGTVHGRRVTVERTDDGPLWFEHDGEVLPPGPAEYTVDVVPAAVPVLTTPSLAVAA
ncbi:diacylglycerol/lipid kinase family protein [Actinophytocola oryzae]|uniref:Diacylglycerol kinase (ATP) n=1 Tax=Actinophytocola oryzae TaxID=502181 RepID=A0A4R7V2S0_9PSEU|nr:diacylglycerol kinase family protein [Actinophytocola oryzae]TDV41746.1 diacylglycerol kinase (ATP) [Actinophytocola oryzae]